VTVLPPATLVGLTETDCNSGGAFGSEPRSIQKDLVTPAAVASMRTELCRKTRDVVMSKLFAVFPEAIDTVAGTWASAGSLVLKDTVPPPTGAGIMIPTIPRVELPPMTALGRTSRAKTVGMPGGAG
jgi:hypothetical protein